MSKHTVVCSRHIARVRPAIRSWCRLANKRSAAVWSWAPTCHNQALRRATMAWSGRRGCRSCRCKCRPATSTPAERDRA